MTIYTIKSTIFLVIFYIFVKPGSLLQDIGRCYIYIRAENILEILI
ncbi:hypothetical protein BQ8769_82 [Escherichia coli]|uniref:Uncharacterized protein n=1 Tax=Escherichia coli TaxID=562 RepID=A0A1W1EMD7_ECOLX|nr:hypothetical protein BQ8769_82 [Escherichia coli]